MEQKQDIQNKPHNDQGEKQNGVSPAITGIAIAVWIFIGLTALLWFVIGNNIADGAKRFEIGIMAMLNIAIVVIVVVHAVIYHSQTKAMIAQSEIALRQFEITDRPWLAVDIAVISPLTFSKQGGSLTFRIVAENVAALLPSTQRSTPKWLSPISAGICSERLSQNNCAFARTPTLGLCRMQSFREESPFRIGALVWGCQNWNEAELPRLTFFNCTLSDVWTINSAGMTPIIKPDLFMV